MLKSSALFSALASHSNHNLIKSGSNTSSLSSRRPSKRLEEREQGQDGSWRWTFRLELEPVHFGPVRVCGYTVFFFLLPPNRFSVESPSNPVSSRSSPKKKCLCLCAGDTGNRVGDSNSISSSRARSCSFLPLVPFSHKHTLDSTEIFSVSKSKREPYIKI